jgi:CspA family cold shock protein
VLTVPLKQRRVVARLRGLAEGQKITYEVEADRRSGKESAVNLKTA